MDRVSVIERMTFNFQYTNSWQTKREYFSYNYQIQLFEIIVGCDNY